MLFIHGLGSRVRTLETDLMEGFVVTKKPTTPKDTKGQGDTTNTQHNGHATALHSSSLWRSHTSGCRRGMQLQCNFAWDVGLLVSTSRRSRRTSAEDFGNCGHARVPVFLNSVLLFLFFFCYIYRPLHTERAEGKAPDVDFLPCFPWDLTQIKPHVARSR